MADPPMAQRVRRSESEPARGAHQRLWLGAIAGPDRLAESPIRRELAKELRGLMVRPVGFGERRGQGETATVFSDKSRVPFADADEQDEAEAERGHDFASHSKGAAGGSESFGRGRRSESERGPPWTGSANQARQSRAPEATSMSETPLSGAGASLAEPFLSGTGSNRATTTERRTTTTTTTTRTVKSSDDLLPAASEMEQVRSESRSGEAATSGCSGQRQTECHSAGASSAGHFRSASPAAGLASPTVQDTEEGRVLKLRFDLAQYAPEEIVVKTVESRLTVQAKHEEKSENRSVYREYNREFHLPDGTDVELIKSSLSKEGILTVECPLPKPHLFGASRRIPIDKV